MTMKLTQLKTHWTAGDAGMIIAFLDDLKDLIWSAYGPDIIEQHRQMAEQENSEVKGGLSPTLNEEVNF